MIGKWRYGIVNYRHPSNSQLRFYGIGELYYKDDPNKIYYCSDPVNPFTEEELESNPQENLLIQLNRMINDITKFPQPFDEDGPYEKEEESFIDTLDEQQLDEYIKSIEEDEQQ